MPPVRLTARARLAVALGVAAGLFAAELVGGLVSGSLALVADAAHVASDAVGLALAVVAASVARRPATAERSFGLLRAEVLGAAANSVLLLGTSLWLLVAAAGRYEHPPSPDTAVMLGLGVAGMLANAVSSWVLRPGTGESLNLRAARLEALADLLGAAAVVAAAGVIRVTGLTRADAVASALIALLILPRTWALLREALDVLLEATPRGVSLADVREHIRGVPGVVGVHDLHAWTIASGHPVLSAHVVVSEQQLRSGGGGPLLDRLAACLGDHFDVRHCTFQLEPEGHAEHEAPGHHD